MGLRREIEASGKHSAFSIEISKIESRDKEEDPCWPEWQQLEGSWRRSSSSNPM